MGTALLDHPPVVGALAPPPGELESLLEQARGGDRRAMEDLLRASYDQVYPVCRRIVGNETDAADAAQEALISVVRGVGRFDGRSRFTTWLYRIAVNASIDELRRRSRRRVVPLAAEPASGASSGMGEPLFTGAGPEDGLGMLDVEAALLELPLDYRAAVVLRDVCGLDYAEIAEVLAIPGGTVRSRIARGRSLLAGLLQPGPEAQA